MAEDLAHEFAAAHWAGFAGPTHAQEVFERLLARDRSKRVTTIAGTILWVIHEWDFEGLIDFDKDTLICEDLQVGPDRRLFTTRVAAEQAAVAEFRAERIDGANADFKAEAAARGERADLEDLSDMPVMAWRDVEEGEGPWVNDTTEASRVCIIEGWDTRYYVIPLTVIG